MGFLTILALAISSIVILITLGKLSRQLDKITTILNSMDRKLTYFHSIEDSKIIQSQSQLHDLIKEVKTIKHDIDWKG
jgi:uncharacterized protein YoxC